VRGQVEQELAVEHGQLAGGLSRAQEIGVVDELVEPTRTRSAIARAIVTSAEYGRRGQHGNIPL
jgi:acetyl-CoA/propionyl-CoA carboxylase carboxyl transferase subunit